MGQGDERSYGQSSTDPSSPSTDALSAKASQSISSPQKPASIRTSGRLANRRAKNRVTSHSKSDKVDSPKSSIRSSEISSRSSHQTVTPEDKSVYITGRANNKPRRNGIVSPNSPPTTGTRQRSQYADDDTDHGVNTTRRTKFLERNRTAATKCRQKKREWVTDLEETKFDLENQHNLLQREYSDLKTEITEIKSQLMNHSSCNDPNIDKWIENEAKRFVLGTSEKYDQMLVNLSHSPRHIITRQDSFSSAAGCQAMRDSELLSPVTPSHSFHPGGFEPNPSILYHPDLTPNFPQVAASDSHEEPYPVDTLHNTTAEDMSVFHSIPMVETFENFILPTS
ncbi:Cyclic AMP-dependent transcription factor ATF-7 [Daldinia childiae]|uniref:Cyclic AMP-dependent transcription factor ATF-7 n=1 Tax=Daldinia childiae TaxID=326645 RepID=UPI001446746B|nr:Cyclic AMP-dependent transcription factor ATF-7 [Daldinia childiae]KAF3065135.1 Cyclic AMP-dependent transcription factor ATF-7 [Daldinia childiae]